METLPSQVIDFSPSIDRFEDADASLHLLENIMNTPTKKLKKEPDLRSKKIAEHLENIAFSSSSLPKKHNKLESEEKKKLSNFLKSPIKLINNRLLSMFASATANLTFTSNNESVSLYSSPVKNSKELKYSLSDRLSKSVSK
jgi:hypothetical protein